MMKEYKGFFIERVNNKVEVRNRDGIIIRIVRTIKDAKKRIDNQTI